MTEVYFSKTWSILGYHDTLSDHALIFGIVRDRIKSNKPEIISFRSFKNFNAETFNQELSLAPWHVGEIFEDVEDQLFYWNTLMKNIVDEHAPVKTMRVRDHDVPCMTTKWKNAIRAKRKAEAKYRQNKTAANCEHKRICRNEAKKQRRLAIKEYWKTKSEDLKRNPRDFFKTFKPFLSDKGIRSYPDIELNIQGNFVKDQIKVTEILADHFATIADGIGGTDAELRNLEDFNDHPSVQLIEDKSRGWEAFDFQEVTPAQVKSVLESLDVNKATGLPMMTVFLPNPEGRSRGNISTTLYSLQLVHQKGSMAM